MREQNPDRSKDPRAAQSDKGQLNLQGKEGGTVRQDKDKTDRAEGGQGRGQTLGGQGQGAGRGQQGR